MKKIGVLGAGMVGRAIALDLANNFEVTSIDISPATLQMVKNKNNSIQTLERDLKKYESYANVLSSFDMVVTAVPGCMGYKTLEAVIKAKKDVVDISFSPENVLDLDSLAKQNNITAIVDCGVAPGISNLILGYYNQRMQVTSFDCLVGGLPKVRTLPFEYKAPFSPIDVIEEYTRPARYMENGVIVTRPALSDAELIDFKNTGTLESFNTDGLRSILFTMGHIPNMKEKTLRYPGHIHLIKSLISGGFFNEEKINHNGISLSPLEFSSKILFEQWKLGEEEPEFTIMKIKVSGTQNGKGKQVTYDLYDEYDPVTKTSSMARTTGYTCTAAVNLFVNGLFRDKGVFPPELIGKDEQCFNFIFKYLGDRGVKYTITEDY